MIFNILSKSEKKRLRREYLENWHDWFAWYPVRMNAVQVAWLEIISRKYEYLQGKNIVDIVYMPRRK